MSNEYSSLTTEEFEKASSEKIKMMESKRIYLENTILRENYESERKKLASTAEKLLNKGSKEAIDNLFKYTEDIQDAILERLRKEVVEKNEKKIVELVEEFTKGEQEELKKMEKLLKEQEKECGVVINRFNSVKEKYEMERIARKKLEYEVMEVKGNIRVFCRVRPAITEDEKFGLSETLKIPNDGEIIVASREQVLSYETDYVFGPESTQKEIFHQISPFVEKLMKGFNMCIFAYGQTGSGKTYTMEGPEDNHGINHRALQKLFEIAGQNTDYDTSFTMSVYEIYNNHIIDLQDADMDSILAELYENAEFSSDEFDISLTRKGLSLKLHQYADGSTEIEGIKKTKVFSMEEVIEIYRKSTTNRMTASHKLNEHSSRSHLIVSIKIEGKPVDDTVEPFTSYFQLIDLAGSERVNKTGASGFRLKEAQQINTSLCNLSTVISAISSQENFVPYRNCKLTQVLKNSMSGNSKVLMFVNVSPLEYNAPETISSLEFATKCRNTCLAPEFRVKPSKVAKSQKTV